MNLHHIISYVIFSLIVIYVVVISVFIMKWVFLCFYIQMMTRLSLGSVTLVSVVVQCDQVKNGVAGCDDKEMTDYCQQHGFDAWFETSAKENVNIEEAARFLIARVSYLVMLVKQ